MRIVRAVIFAALIALTACGGGTNGTSGTGGTNTPNLVSLQLTPANPSVVVGKTQQFKAMGTFSDNSTQDLTSTATWSSSSTTLAQVNNAGLATAMAAGTATINAASGSVNGSTSLVVSSTASSAQITSLSETTANPFDLLTITGSGFNSAATVNFSAAGGLSVNVQPEVIGQTSLTVSVPVLFSGTTAAGGTANVAVVESSALSNSIQLQIGGLPPAPPAASGTITLGFLQGELAAVGNFQQSVSGTSGDSPQLELALSAEINSITLAVNQIAPVVSGSATSALLGSVNGTSLSVSAADLASTDRTLIGVIQAIAALPASSSARAGTHLKRSRMARSSTVSSSGIEQDAQNLYSVSTSVGATQGQVSAAVATWINAAGDTTDTNFGKNLAIAAGIGFSVGLAINPVTAGPLLVALVGEPPLLMAFLEAAPNIIVDVEQASNGLGLANAFLQQLVEYAWGKPAALAYALVGADLEAWDDVIEEICGSLTNCFSITPLPPFPSLPSLLTSLTLAPYGSAGPGSATLTGPGGTPVTGILIFSGLVLPGGASVTMSADNSAAQLGASSITVPGGQNSATFTINTSTVTVQTVVHISATVGSVVQTATLTLVPSTTWTGTFSAPFIGTATDPDGGLYSATADFTFTLTLAQSSNGSISGSASVPTNVNISVVSCPPSDSCSPDSFSATATGSVTGTNGNISGSLSSGGTDPLTISFTGVISGKSMAVTGGFSYTFVGTGTDGPPTSNPLSGTISGLTLTEQ
jgi:trimeric autotransporter adhesin